MGIWHRTAAAGLLAAALLAGAAWPQEPALAVPEEVHGAVGQFVTVAPTGAGKVVRYVVLDAGLAMLDQDQLKDPRQGVFTGARPGRYAVLALTTVNGDLAKPVRFAVVLAGDPGPPPPPDPKPLPPLAKLLKAGLDLDPPADRAHLPAAAQVMRRAAAKALDPNVLTTAALAAAVFKDRQDSIREALPNLRTAIGRELNKALPADNTALTEAMRKEIAAKYAEIADALEALR